jgi:hypothetical protein
MHPLTAETWAARGPSTIWWQADRSAQSIAAEESNDRKLVKGRGRKPSIAGGPRKHVDAMLLREARSAGATLEECSKQFGVGVGVIRQRLKELTS